MPGTRTAAGSSVPAGTMRLTWAMTMPPALCAAWAMASRSWWKGSSSHDRLPSASAVVARISATPIGRLG